MKSSKKKTNQSKTASKTTVDIPKERTFADINKDYATKCSVLGDFMVKAMFRNESLLQVVVEIKELEAEIRAIAVLRNDKEPTK